MLTVLINESFAVDDAMHRQESQWKCCKRERRQKSGSRNV